MKRFSDSWTDEDIGEYLAKNNILVLFKKSLDDEYSMSIYCDSISEEQKKQLIFRFYSMFGSHEITNSISEKINEVAIKWYNKVIL